MKSVVHVSIRHPALDTRIFYKECLTLKNADYSVNLIVPHPKSEKIEGINIVPLPIYKKRINKIMINILLTLIKSIKLNADIYHIHDPELIPLGLILKLFGKKLIYDAHEDFYSDTKSKKWLGVTKRPIALMLSFFEKVALRTFNNVIVATPTIGENLKSEKTILIRNFPIINFLDKYPKQEKNRDCIKIIYAGGLTRDRGIKELIISLENLNSKVELLLLGKWEEGFYQECKELKSWSYTKYLGKVPFKETLSYLSVSHIGIATLYPTDSYLKSLPVKVFEYMAFSIPTVMSDFPYWKEMYSECALFVDPHDPKDIAEKINTLIDDRKLREKLGQKGRELIETKYNWEKESKKLIKLYESLS